jgi:serine/threonine-protein kinase
MGRFLWICLNLFLNQLNINVKPMAGITPKYELKISIEPPMGGKVNGAGKYTEGKEVQVDVTAFTGWEFVKWSGELSHSKPNFSITLNKNVNMTAHFKKATKLIDWLTVLRGIILLLPITAFLYSIPYFTRVKLSQTEITIGTLWKPEATQDLADFLEAKSVPSNYFDFLQGKKIRVRINGDSTLAYKEAESRMESKQWDIAFTNSPILSVSAKENSYKYVAGMFPRSNFYQSGLFVRTDSSIRSLRDIQASTRVGLGSFSSASSFYMPVYDLYGKSITANVGNRGGAIINLVKEGKVEIGAAAIGDSIRGDDPTIRIIHVSRDIPGAGVYASPNLSTSDYEQIRQLMGFVA